MSATAENTFDIVILGGGSGGYACALRAAELGLSVALVEKGKLGGTCLHMGCIPTKALLHAAEVADTAREGMQFGVKTTFESVDMSGVNAYKDGVVGRLYKGLQGLVKSKSIEYVEGEGRLVAKNVVEVAGRQLVGKNVVLATGSYAKSLPGLDIAGRIMTSEQALFLDFVPLASSSWVAASSASSSPLSSSLSAPRSRSSRPSPAWWRPRTRRSPSSSSGPSASARSTSRPA